jgi:hypothetical protein
MLCKNRVVFSFHAPRSVPLTGCGLPPGPGGALGAAEGASYLAVLALAGAGIGRRASGKGGLPGLLGVPEGLAYAALGLGAVVLGKQVGGWGGWDGVVDARG